MWNGLARRWRKRSKKFGASDKGIAAIEFALVSPPFILLLGCMLETGMMLFTEYSMQAAAADAARWVRTGQAQTTPISSTAFKNKICLNAPAVVNCASNLTVYVQSEANFATLKANLPALIQIGPTVGSTITRGPCYKTGQPSQPAAVVLTYDWNTVMFGMSAFANLPGTTTRRLSAVSIFQNEPFPGAGQAAC